MWLRSQKDVHLLGFDADGVSYEIPLPWVLADQKGRFLRECSVAGQDVDFVPEQEHFRVLGIVRLPSLDSLIPD